jgi:predicted nucleotidyltransferase/biotin operon repressor
MKYTHPLDDLLSQKSKVRILRYLTNSGLELSGRQIANEIGMSPWVCHQALGELRDQGVLLMRNVGNTHLYRLNSRHYLVQDLLLPLFRKERKLLDTVIAEITNDLPASVISLILYGSVARSEEEPFSDIDLLAVTISEEDTAVVEQFLLHKNESLVPRFGNTVAALVMSTAELYSRLDEGDSLITEIMQTGRVIYGKRLVDLLSRSEPILTAADMGSQHGT